MYINIKIYKAFLLIHVRDLNFFNEFFFFSFSLQQPIKDLTKKKLFSRRVKERNIKETKKFILKSQTGRERERENL